MKRFLFIFLILAFSLCFVLMCSASEYDFIITDDSIFNNISDHSATVMMEYTPYALPTDNYYYEIYYIDYYTYNGYSVYAFQPASFKLFVDHLSQTAPGCSSYELFTSSLDYSIETFSSSVLYYWSVGDYNLTEEYFNQLYFYNSGLSYEDGVSTGIIQAHDYTKEWLSDNEILTEPWGSSGDLSSLEGLLNDNVLNALNNKYTAGYVAGKDEGLTEGTAEGYNLGRAEGYATGKSDGIIEGEKIGYNKGKADGIAIGETTSDSLRQGIFAIISAPIELISSVLNFELFGINLFALVTGLMTLCLAIWVIKKFIKG